MKLDNIICGHSLEVLKSIDSESIDCCVTSPPYWGLRDYQVNGQLGLETTMTEYIDKLCTIFDEIKRVLKKGGTCWVVVGDTYYGGGNNRGNTQHISAKQASNVGATGQVQIKWGKALQSKSLCQIPSRFSIEMSNRGWILRNRIIWHKPSCMPTSVKDRFTVDYEDVFFFVKNKKYYFEQQLEPAVRDWSKNGGNLMGKGIHKHSDGYIDRGNGRDISEPMMKRNKRTVWSTTAKPFKGSHFATFPPKLIEPMIKAGCPVGGIVLDPFIGSGTTGMVAKQLDRHYIGIELNPEYIEMAYKRIL